ncbi:MAG TPA: hypothetical protein DG753_09335 [Clostridium sp.]|nr:hypothetical protein [Clostridium sp.]
MMFSGKNKKNRNKKNKDENNKSIYVDDSTRSVGHSPVDLAPLLRKMEKRKKASKALGAISSLIIIIGLAASGFYVYKMFQPIESASISFDDINDASPEEKQKSEENRNKPLTYSDGNQDDGRGQLEIPDSNDNDNAKDESKKNIQNGNAPSYIANLPEKTSYRFNASIFSSNTDSDNYSKTADNSSDENSSEEKADNEDENSTRDEEENHNKKKHKESVSKNNESSTKNQSALSNDSGNKKSNSDKKETKSQKVTLTIVGYDGKYVLDTKSIKFSGTQTVASILFSACNKYDIPYKYKGSGSTVYISSLGGQAEKEHGSGSGWMVRVNGYLIDRSAGAWKVKDGDDIDWFYYSGSLENIPRE